MNRRDAIKGGLAGIVGALAVPSVYAEDGLFPEPRFNTAEWLEQYFSDPPPGGIMEGCYFVLHRTVVLPHIPRFIIKNCVFVWCGWGDNQDGVMFDFPPDTYQFRDSILVNNTASEKVYGLRVHQNLSVHIPPRQSKSVWGSWNIFPAKGKEHLQYHWVADGKGEWR